MVYRIVFDEPILRMLSEINYNAVPLFVSKHSKKLNEFGEVKTYDHFSGRFWNSVVYDGFLGYTLDIVNLGTYGNRYEYLIDMSVVDIYGKGVVYRYLYDKVIPYVRDEFIDKLV